MFIRRDLSLLLFVCCVTTPATAVSFQGFSEFLDQLEPGSAESRSSTVTSDEQRPSINQGSRSSTLGAIPPGTIEIEGGCTHYLRLDIATPGISSPVVFHWGYPGLSGPGGDCISNCWPFMHLFGKIVTVKPETSWPEELIAGKNVGDSFTELYRLGTLQIRFDNQVIFVCPNSSGNEDRCEVTKYQGVLTIGEGAQREFYQTYGECGL